MNNAQILANSINEWVGPIVEKAMQGFANQNQWTFMLSSLITPERLLRAVQEHLSVPLIYEQVSKLPDAVIPEFSLEIINGMVQTRLEKGPLDVPMLGIRLTPDAFKNLHAIAKKNFDTYSDNAEKEEEERL